MECNSLDPYIKLYRIRFYKDNPGDSKINDVFQLMSFAMIRNLTIEKLSHLYINTMDDTSYPMTADIVDISGRIMSSFRIMPDLSLREESLDLPTIASRLS